MKNSLKGALLSGVVFPGLGQFVLKRYKRGVILMLAVFAGLIAIATIAAQQAFAVLEKIEMEGGAITLKTVTDAASRASSTSGSLIINMGLFVIAACWGFAIVDAYRIGKKLDS